METYKSRANVCLVNYSKISGLIYTDSMIEFKMEFLGKYTAAIYSTEIYLNSFTWTLFWWLKVKTDK